MPQEDRVFYSFFQIRQVEGVLIREASELSLQCHKEISVERL